MILIESEVINNSMFHFYNGIDFELVQNHPRDGSSGFLVFLVDSFLKEIKSHNRDKKLNSVISNNEFIPFDIISNYSQIDNEFIAIYQYEEVGFNTMLDVVKKKVKRHWLLS